MPREAEPDLPPAIDAAFARGLAKDPRDRPHTTVGLVEEIERALSGPVATESTRAMAPVVPIAPAPRPARAPGGADGRRAPARERSRAGPGGRRHGVAARRHPAGRRSPPT